jgi:HlyD family secretion protein
MLRPTKAAVDGAPAAASQPTRWITGVVALVALALGGWAVSQYSTEITAAASRLVRHFRGPVLPAGFASGNGRIEATEYDIATKRAGRIAEVMVREGDMVSPGQILARIDTQDLDADLRQAEAQSAQARQDKRRALAAVEQRGSEVQSAVAAIAQRQSDLRRADAAIAQRRSGLEKAEALIVQRESELALARKELQRSRSLFDRDLIARQKLDEDLTRVETAVAALAQERAGRQVAEGALLEAQAQRQIAEAALVQQEAQRQAAGSALAAARIDVDYREAAIAAAAARVERIRTDIADSTLASPIRGRVLYRLAEPGEVLSAGGKVVTVLELSDVYMTIFLPTEEAGRALIGAEGRIVLDAAPHLVIPAAVSFVAPRAQFTPKEVETRTEREKLMFRVKVRIDPELLARHSDRVKTGLPGVAYVRLDSRAEWPEHLRIKLAR